jgi:hypothetical protein
VPTYYLVNGVGMRIMQCQDWLWARLAQLQTMELSRDALLMKLGGAQSKVPAAWRLVTVKVDQEGAAFTHRLNRQKLKQVRRSFSGSARDLRAPRRRRSNGPQDSPTRGKVPAGSGVTCRRTPHEWACAHVRRSRWSHLLSVD